LATQVSASSAVAATTDSSVLDSGNPKVHSRRLVRVDDDCPVCARLGSLLERHQRDVHSGSPTPNHPSSTPETLTVSESSSAEEPTAGRTLQDIERVHIGRVIVETNGNISKAARILAIDRTTLYDKLKRYGLKS